MNADDAGPLSLRLDFPAGAGSTFARVLFPVLAAPVLIHEIRLLRAPADTPSRAVGLAVFAVLLALIAAGFLATMRILNRRPTALEVREKGLLVRYRTRVEAIEWPTVKGVEQAILGVVPTYVVHFHGRRRLVVGTDERALALAREIVRKAGLRWIHEPFSAVR